MTVAVRKARHEDAPRVLELVDALADYERLPRPDAGARERLLRDGFGPSPRFDLLVGERDGAPVGYALFFETYSSFLARPTLYLEDLFVLPAWRGHGVGRRLLGHLAAIAIERGCGRMEWCVLDWNESAIGFYRRLGARVLDDWRICRLTGDALSRAAAADA